VTTTHAAFDAALFDFGGVFIDSPFAAAEAAAARLGVPLTQLSDIVFGSYEDDNDHPWHRLERGELSFDDARAQIVELSRSSGLVDVDPIDVLSTLSVSSSGVRDFMVDLVREFRSHGVKTGIVTNNIREFGEYWRSMLPLDELFDDVVDSSEVGVRKPNPEIFRLACERIGAPPARTLFVDDFEGNVLGAEQVGLVGVCCGYTVESSRAAAAHIRLRAGFG
jgi:epoxide hydrolase-like predicted phosphatase